jgi:hypothetical protein
MEIEGNNYAIQTSNKPYQIDPNPYNNDQYFNSNIIQLFIEKIFLSRHIKGKIIHLIVVL